MSEPIEITIKRGDQVFRIPSMDCTADITIKSEPVEYLFGGAYPGTIPSPDERRVSFHIGGTSSSRMVAFFGVRDPWYKRILRGLASLRDKIRDRCD
jgi:hypothetical protein